MSFDEIASDQVIDRTVQALQDNGIQAVVTASGAEARDRVLALLPPECEVMQMSSTTLDVTGLTREINESGRYHAVKATLGSMDPKTQEREMKRLGSAPDYSVGSVHALTEDGHALIASNTGSQLAAYSSGAAHVIWVVGAQKIVKNLDEGMKRIYEYVLPLESERVKKAYGMPSSFVSKILLVNREHAPGRITVVIVKETLGF